MSFRKRNVGVSTASSTGQPTHVVGDTKPPLPGVRPSPLDGRPVTSTGTASLDGMLAGHTGLALGCSLLIEENGTTDYAGALLKFYASEGLLQGHHVHVVALPEQWGRDLPGTSKEQQSKLTGSASADKMKIAWRYEGLGQFDSKASREAARTQVQSESTTSTDSDVPFSHNFDLSKRLVHPGNSKLDFYPLQSAPSSQSARSPFTTVISKLTQAILGTPPTVVHRIIIPSFLSPFWYPIEASQPQNVLGFIHSLRSILGLGRITILSTLPVSLHPRASGLTRWIEILHDGVFELSPFPHSADALEIPTTKGQSESMEDQPQGLLRIHRMPVLHEHGVGNRSHDDDWTFSLSRRTLKIRSFNLPPMGSDQDDQQEGGASVGDANKSKKSDLEF